MSDKPHDTFTNLLAPLGVLFITLLLIGLTAYTFYISASSAALDAIQDAEVWIVVAASLIAIGFVIVKSSQTT